MILQCSTLWLLLICGTIAESKGENKRPNFVVILADDLDWTLGGSQASTLSNTRRLIGDEGIQVSNWFAHSPVCCPSRAQLLTGKMFHNLRTKALVEDDHMANSKNCMLVNVTDDSTSSFYANDYFAQHFADLGYTVGIFGKHLNTQNPTDFVPKGVDYWMINGGGDYINPSFRWASSTGHPSPTSVSFDNCTGVPCYSTSVIGNSSLAWMDRHLSSESSETTPFWSLISVKAPHIQDGNGFPMATPAPWYTQTDLPNETIAPRTPHYNQSCPDHHWLARTQPPLTSEQGQKVDELYRSRLRTLLSVDDLVVDLVALLKRHSVLDSTYIVFTSDHGYRLGQWRMPQGKWHAYENDIRVPFMIRGPGVMAGKSAAVTGTHVDVMPTLLGLAQQSTLQDIVPPRMDGTNLAGLLLGEAARDQDHKLPSSSTALIIEHMTRGSVVRYEHLEDCANKTFIALRLLPNSNPPGQSVLSNNMKYIEYRDSHVDWECDHPPLERELFDLDKDPYEMYNLAVYNRTSETVLRLLGQELARLFRCQGEVCRNERNEGLDLSLVSML